MLESVPFRLIVLAALIAFLRVSIWRRRRAEEAGRQAEEKQWPATAFDASAISPQLQRVRQDHLAALHPRPHEAWYRKGLIATVRRLISDLSYFHRV